MGVEWVQERHTADEIDALARDLRDRRITHAYVYVSYMKPDGSFNPTYSNASELTRSLHAIDPGLDVQAWIGLPLKDGKGGYVDLADETTRRSIAEFGERLIQEKGFDGIHLDPEPVVSGDATLLALLDEIRQAIGPDATLSIAARRIQPVAVGPLAALLDGFGWRPGYYREVADRVDQIAVMIYDSGLPLPGLYRWWVMRQVVEIGRATNGQQVELFFGVPTSEERTRTHWPNAENMRSGLEGVLDGLSTADAMPRGVIGVAVYPYWETDDAEWATYKSLWLGQ
ncbi:MAG: glycosyl hydrolase family 18 protein [Anaerolineae bacterium]